MLQAHLLPHSVNFTDYGVLSYLLQVWHGTSACRHSLHHAYDQSQAFQCKGGTFWTLLYRCGCPELDVNLPDSLPSVAFWRRFSFKIELLRQLCDGVQNCPHQLSPNLLLQHWEDYQLGTQPG